MSVAPDRFAAGVALYGFVHNRWMTYEGGDYTWEDEYAAQGPAEASGKAASDVWPLPRELEAADNFNALHRIRRPLLLMHGEKDDICPLSQSSVAFHVLEKAGVPTG